MSIVRRRHGAGDMVLVLVLVLDLVLGLCFGRCGTAAAMGSCAGHEPIKSLHYQTRRRHPYLHETLSRVAIELGSRFLAGGREGLQWRCIRQALNVVLEAGDQDPHRYSRSCRGVRHVHHQSAEPSTPPLIKQSLNLPNQVLDSKRLHNHIIHPRLQHLPLLLLPDIRTDAQNRHLLDASILLQLPYRLRSGIAGEIGHFLVHEDDVEGAGTGCCAVLCGRGLRFWRCVAVAGGGRGGVLGLFDQGAHGCHSFLAVVGGGDVVAFSSELATEDFLVDLQGGDR